jgi:hypothetical protein
MARRKDLVIDFPVEHRTGPVGRRERRKHPGQRQLLLTPPRGGSYGINALGRSADFRRPGKDLDTGNTTYKAVQRSAQVGSIGPMLQGLARPVNDLSRGALVEDIIYTMALTAIQSRAG